MGMVRWGVRLWFRGRIPAIALLLVLASACGRTRVSSHDGAVPDSLPTAFESGRTDVNGPPSFSDAASDTWQPATETGAADVDAPLLSSDLGTHAEVATDTPDVAASPDVTMDTPDVDLAMLDLGAEADGGAGSETSLPVSCAGQDLFVDVSDGSSTTRLVYSGGSAVPVATGNGTTVTISVSQSPNSGGTNFYVQLAINGPQSATTMRVVWTPAGQSTSMTNCCGGACSAIPVTITRFDTGGGILEGDFKYFAVGHTCEGPDATLSGHFQVCYIPTN